MSRVTAMGTVALSCEDDEVALQLCQEQVEARAQVVLYAVIGALVAVCPLTALVTVLAS